MSNIFDMPHVADMSFREKSAWISFVSILIVTGAYFAALVMHERGVLDHPTTTVVLLGLIGTLVITEIVLHAAMAMRRPSEARAPKDEREQLIEMRATYVAFQVLVVAALACVGLMHVTRSAWAIAQHLLLAIFLAELVKFGGQIVYFRRGI